MFRRFHISVLLLLAACINDISGITQDEYDVFSTVLSIRASKLLVLIDSTTVGTSLDTTGFYTHKNDPRLIPHTGLSYVQGEMLRGFDSTKFINAFRLRNRARSPLSLVPLRSKGRLLATSQAKIDSLFSNYGPKGWLHFWRMYGREAGFLSFSRVVFNDDGKIALVYVEYSCGDLCGSGEWFLLSRDSSSETGWSIIDRNETWVS